MQLNLNSNMRDVARDLSDAARNQLPFATSMAINATLVEIKNNETKRLDKVLDRPTPFTKRAYEIRRSTKRRLEGRVYVKPIQAKYLFKQEEGGTTTPNRRALIVPQKIKRNRYGNMPRGALKRQLAGPKVFSGTPKGSSRGPGIYKRQGKGIVRLVSYTKRARYQPRLGFKDNARKTALIRFPVHLTREMRKAWATKRR